MEQFIRDSVYAARASLLLLILPLALTLANPDARLRGGAGGGFDWMPLSFAVMGLMLFATALILMTLRRLPLRRPLRTGLTLTVCGGFFLLWAELAVGLISHLFGQ